MDKGLRSFLYILLYKQKCIGRKFGQVLYPLLDHVLKSCVRPYSIKIFKFYLEFYDYFTAGSRNVLNINFQTL